MLWMEKNLLKQQRSARSQGLQPASPEHLDDQEQRMFQTPEEKIVCAKTEADVIVTVTAVGESDSEEIVIGV